MDFLIIKSYIKARTVDPSTVFLTQTVDQSTVLGTIILTYDI